MNGRGSTSRTALVVVLASAGVQVALASLPDTMGDLAEYRLWTRVIVNQGLSAAYWPTTAALQADPAFVPINYPPLFPYLLWAIGHAVRAVSPMALAHADPLLDFLIRLPGCAAVLLLAWTVYAETRRWAPAWAELALAMVALNPAILFDTAYWGQTDALCALLTAASLVALVRGRLEWAWVAAAAAALAKHFAWPVLPLLLLASLKWFPPRRTLRAALAGASMFFAALVPFLWIGRLPELPRALFLRLDTMPYISVNAHNLWWLVGCGLPWTELSAHPLGIRWGTLSTVLFAAFLATTTVWLWRSADRRSLYVAWASMAFGLFVLAARMHENHLFYAVAALALAGLQSRTVRALFLALTVTLLANMALHDPFLTEWARPYVPGPLLAPEAGEETSALGMVATLANAQANVLLFAWWLLVIWRRRGFEGVGAGEPPRAGLRARVLALVFLLVTAVPFLVHTFQCDHLAGPAGPAVTTE